jgi:hypothetical protein
MATRKPKSAEEPWESGNPKPKGARKTLTAAQKSEAKTSAKKAGRPYPNLVDNMKVAKKAKAKRSKAKSG